MAKDQDQVVLRELLEASRLSSTWRPSRFEVVWLPVIARLMLLIAHLTVRLLIVILMIYIIGGFRSEPRAAVLGIALSIVIGFTWFESAQRSSMGSKRRTPSPVSSPARRHDKSRERRTFDEIVLPESILEPILATLEFLKSPEKYQRLGGQIIKGILITGPPGTGKTLVLKAIAGEAGVPCFKASGSDFSTLFSGVCAAQVRETFEVAKENSPCILLIDDIDALARSRSPWPDQHTLEYEMGLSALLCGLDGLTSSDTVILVATTNRPDLLDPALLRPGRIDRVITLPYPQSQEILELVKIHTRNIPLNADVDLLFLSQKLASLQPMVTGACVAALANRAAELATKADRAAVAHEDFLHALGTLDLKQET